MAQESNKAVIWTVVVGVILAIILLGGFMVINGKVNDASNSAAKAAADANTMKNTVNNAVANIPTADEIASKIVVPAPVSVPTQGETLIGGSSGSGDGDQASQLLQAAYPVESNLLETQCQTALIQEFGVTYAGDNTRARIKHIIEANEGQNIVNFQIVDWNYYNDYYFNVLDLGLGNQNNRAAQISRTLRVTYRLEDGNGDLLRDKVYTIGTCSQWDKLDDVFDSLTLNVHL
jgi:hypothetical protein